MGIRRRGWKVAMSSLCFHIVISFPSYLPAVSVSTLHCLCSCWTRTLEGRAGLGQGWLYPEIVQQCVDIQTGFNRTILRRRQNKYNDLGLKLNILDYRARLRAVLPFAKATQKISISIVHPHCPSCTIAEAACIACRSKLQISPVRDTFHRDMWRQRDSDGGVYITTHNILYVDICQAARKQQKSDVKRATELLFKCM